MRVPEDFKFWNLAAIYCNSLYENSVFGRAIIIYRSWYNNREETAALKIKRGWSTIKME